MQFMHSNYLKFFVLLISILSITNLQVEASESTVDNNEETYYTIYLKNSSYANELELLLQERDIEITYKIDLLGLYQVKTSSSDIELLAKDTGIIDQYNLSLEVEPNSVVYSLDNSNSQLPEINSEPLLWNLQWDMKKVTNNGKSYEISEGSMNTVIGIIDSGIYTDHPDLQGSVISSKNFVPSGGLKGEEPNETGDPNLNIDYSGHGTFSAGQITANGLIKGIAPEIGLRSYRVFGSKGAESLWVINAIIEAANDDVDVINLSLGKFLVRGKVKNEKNFIDNTELAEIKAYKKAIDYAYKKGSVVVASIGNQGLNLRDNKELKQYFDQNFGNGQSTYMGRLQFIPAQLQKVISVSSIGPTNELSTFSNYGKNIVDIATYGGDTRLLEKYGELEYFTKAFYQQELILSTTTDGGYNYSIGTSFASPKVSGALALLIDHYGLHDKPQKARVLLLNKSVEKGNGNLIGSDILNIYNGLDSK